MKTITSKGLNPHTFEIVDHVPAGFMIWNIPTDNMQGYLPLCEMMDPTNKKDFRINPDTLKAIKVEDNEALVIASIHGAGTLKKAKREMARIEKRIAEGKANRRNLYAYELIKKAMPQLEKIEWQ